MLNAGVPVGIVESMGIDMRKHRVIISAALSCFVSLALALHHDAAPFQRVTFSICKVTNAPSVTPHKTRTDSTSAPALLSSLISNESPARSTRVAEADSFHPSVIDFSAFPNKAPPVHL